MRYTLLMTIALLGIATADAQTVTEPNNQTSTGQNVGTNANGVGGGGVSFSVGSDPLSVPTSTLRSGSPRAVSGPASGADATGSAGGSIAGASASPSSNPQLGRREHSGRKRIAVEQSPGAVSVAGRNAEHLLAGGDHDGDRAEPRFANLPTAGALD